MDVKKLFEAYKINPQEHPNMIVTANGNIYLDGKIDPKDRSDEVYPGGEVIDDTKIEGAKPKTKK